MSKAIWVNANKRMPTYGSKIWAKDGKGRLAKGEGISRTELLTFSEPFGPLTHWKLRRVPSTKRKKDL